MDIDLTLTRDAGGRPTQGWAFTVSTWIHLLLLALIVWVPIHRPTEKPKEEVVEFDVAKPQQQKPPPRPPREAMPFRRAPSPPPASRPATPAPRAMTQPLPSGSMSVPPDRVGAAPSDPRPTQTPSRATPFPRDDGRSADGPPGEPPPGPGLGDGTPAPKDLRSALLNFRRSVARSGLPGGGEGEGGSSGKGGGFKFQGISPSGFGFGNLVFEDRDFDWTPYARQIHNAILKAWYSRLYAMADQFDKWAFARGSWILEHQNQIRFTIRRSGEVTDIEVESDSGCPPLDASATDALREVVLPPLPDDFQRDEETIHVFFIARGDIHAMRTDPLLRQAYYGE